MPGVLNWGKTHTLYKLINPNGDGATEPALLKEDTDFLLLEDGFKILLNG